MQRRILLLGAMYVPLSFVSGLAFVTVPAQMRDGGQSLILIGFQTIVMLPWLMKFLWAPYVERYRLPPHGHQRTPRIAAAGVIVSTAMLVVLTGTSDLHPFALLGCLLIAATAVATVDIACDGFTIDTYAQAQRGWANTAQVGGAYIGIALSGGLFLLVASYAGWTATMCGLVCLSVVLPLPFLRLSRRTDLGCDRPHRPDLSSALANPRIRVGLVLVLACSAGARLSQSMIVPLLVDRGLDLATIGLINGGGVIVSLIGTLCAGVAVRHIGTLRPIVWALGAQAGCLAILALSSHTGSAPAWLLTSIVVSLSGATAFGIVALYAELMAYTSPDQPGVDFTVFQCCDAGFAILAGPASGVLATRLGYTGCFAFATCVTVMAATAVPLLVDKCRSSGWR